ncbi:MAG: hypothetical protein SVU88_04185 [Candidatus Nanohaloarchaea archaeon]|nr:hypothetical protein [Candidatus Nanohaloarchaea archaeon]
MTDAVRACPNCGSTDIGHDSLDVVSRLSLSGSRACRDCGYTGVFPEVPADEVDAFDGAQGEQGGGEREAGTAAAAGPRRGRLALGVLLFLLGIGATASSTWGSGLLAGFLALVVGAAVVAEQLAARFQMRKE